MAGIKRRLVTLYHAPVEFTTSNGGNNSGTFHYFDSLKAPGGVPRGLFCPPRASESENSSTVPCLRSSRLCSFQREFLSSSHNTDARMAQDEPGDRRTEIALQRNWDDRRAPSRVAAGDEPPMNFHETHVL